MDILSDIRDYVLDVVLALNIEIAEALLDSRFCGWAHEASA